MCPTPATTPHSALTEAEHATYMRRAIELSAQGGLVEKVGGCFGAVIVQTATKTIVGEGYNHVISSHDPTWHGEVGAIRDACTRLARHHLRGCVLYTSAEPCPMCYSACLWARLDAVYYAATYQDVKHYGNFDDADFMAELAKPHAERSVPCHQILQPEAVEVWKFFAAMPDKVHY